MAYTSGNTILDDHYNTFIAGNANGSGNDLIPNVNSTIGVGSADKGYGQTNTLPVVAPGVKITAIQWANMLNRIDTLAAHQNSSVSGITNPTVGQAISAYTTLQTDVNTVYNNRLNAVASGTSTSGTSVLTGSWTSYSYPRILVGFASNNAMRYFFNAGGLIKYTISRTGGSSTAKNAEWTDLCSKCGTLVFSGGSGTANIAGTNYTGTNKIGGGGTVNLLTTTFGMYDTAPNDSWSIIFRQYADTAPYTANYIEWYVRGKVDNKSIDFAYNLNDAADDNTAGDVVDGTLTMTCTVVQPSTTHISNTWGTITMTARSDGQA